MLDFIDISNILFFDIETVPGTPQYSTLDETWQYLWKHKAKSILKKTDEDWRKQLSPVQFNILREKGTERPFTGEYDKFYEEGTYYCVACGTELFASKTKYNSGCGWPAFYEPSVNKNIVEKKDVSYGMVRIEVLCAKCGGHLGHVFNDGPEPTGLRYCINSGSLKFVEGKKKE